MFAPPFARANASASCFICANIYLTKTPRRDIIHHMVLLSILHQLFRRKPRGNTNTTPQQNIDFNKYMGRWYEQARFENWFELGMDSVSAEYEICADGRISIRNSGLSQQGKRCHSTGKASIKQNGVLQVSFVPPYCWFRAEYNILYVDADYQTALVSGKGSQYLWLLSRQVQADANLLTPLIREAQRRGFDTRQLRYTRQP